MSNPQTSSDYRMWSDTQLWRAIEMTRKHLFLSKEEQQQLIDDYHLELLRRWEVTGVDTDLEETSHDS